MILAAPNIREGLITLLSGNVTYDSVVVPVYEGRGGVGVNTNGRNYQIIIGSQDHIPENTQTSFNGEFMQVIECRAEMKGSAVRKHSDEIAGDVLQLLTPAPNITLLEVEGFQVIHVKATGGRHLIEEGNGSYLVRTILTISIKLNQI